MNPDFSSFGKMLVIIGGVLIAVGICVMLLGKIPGIGRMPGDIMIRRENFSFYFPWVTCLVLSGGITLILWLIGKFRP